MSTVAQAVPRYSRVLGHFAVTRGPEVGMLQASPLLGLWLGGVHGGGQELGRVALLLVASLALTAHVFVLNDWAGYHGDVRDPRRAQGRAGAGAVAREQIALLAAGLLVVAVAGFAVLGPPTVLFAAGVAALGALYSLSPRLGKGTPVAASLNHLAGGALHFLMGYALVHRLDAKGLALSAFFGLVFAAGHLNQEVRDHESDRANGIRTSAVVHGCRASFLASFALFSAAYALLAGLAAAGVLPRLLLVVAPVWALQAWLAREALRRGLDVPTALWMQRRYRLLFAVVGLALLVR